MISDNTEAAIVDILQKNVFSFEIHRKTPARSLFFIKL